MELDVWVPQTVKGLRKLAEWIGVALDGLPDDTRVSAGITFDSHGRDLDSSGIHVTVER